MALSPALGQPAETTWQIESGVLCIQSPLTTDPRFLTVYAAGSSQPLFGSMSFDRGTMRFKPTLPFVSGQNYRAEVRTPDGAFTRLSISLDPSSQVRPTVSLSPSTSEIPANTLKLYLDFTQPMEQGNFLQQITLKRETGEEVAGAFRETELWSPDGKRLTIMFHPGRQKTGVNLNVDEGPVLVEGQGYQLVIAGRWRSAEGVAIGQNAVFRLQAVAPDHEQPDPSKWQVVAPKRGTRDALVVITDELFEPQIFARALNVPGVRGKGEGNILELKRTEWRFTPARAWAAGEHVIAIDPELEDLAGNSPRKPFEVNLTDELPKARDKSITFGISERK